uniref:flagellin N-terminal helical domain-containing protein n=1 Tax=Agathobacter sp. TaxID=2021311 RepID=UPI004056E72F
MRITNNMITRNTKSNINSNKLLVDKYNTQMTTQKKISKASQNPVIAIRSLRLSTTMTHLSQYVDNNIPDASAWMSVTETALTNMTSLLSDIRTQCVNGSTDSLTADDRQTILDSLRAMSEQIYMEGNADYAGKTVFTGYRSSSNLTFNSDEPDTRYQITEHLDFNDLEEKRYYTGTVEVPEALTANTQNCDTVISEMSYERMRLAYNGETALQSASYTYTTQVDDGNGNLADKEITVSLGGSPITEGENSMYDQDGNELSGKFHVFEFEEDWEEAMGSKTIADDDVVYIKSTGEFIFGKNVANTISDKKASFDVTYTKRGFDKGEVRPEYYFDCVDITDDDVSKHVEYTKENQEVNYIIANDTKITINTQADQVFDTGIARDVDELISVVEKAINANEKVIKIERMMTESQYSDKASQDMLQTYLDAAEKERDYADDNLQKTYEHYISRFDGYLETVNIAVTNVGSMKNRLTMTQTRVENQQMTIEQLKSTNEDRDISDIIIDYYAAYNAYQSSLTAAGKLGQSSLLDYI